jgi:hypothetical protein
MSERDDDHDGDFGERARAEPSPAGARTSARRGGDAPHGGDAPCEIVSLALDALDIDELDRRIELAPAGIDAGSWCSTKCAVDCATACTELLICSPNYTPGAR